MEITDKIEDFNADDRDFFSEVAVNTSENQENQEDQEVIGSEEIEDSIKNEKSEETTEKKQEEEEEDLFSSLIETEKNTEENIKSNSALDTYNYLLSIGFLEGQEEEEVTSENAKEIIEAKLDGQVQESVEALLEELPKEVKALNKFVLDGGDFNVFMREIAKTSTVPLSENMDLEDEKNQETIFRITSARKGISENEIESQLDYYKNTGKLAIIARERHEDWIEEKNRSENEIVERQRKEQIERAALLKEQRQEAFRLMKDPNIGFKIPTNDMQNMNDYMHSADVKLTNGSAITNMQKDIYYEVLNNPKAKLQLAHLMRNRKEDGSFNFSSFLDKGKKEAFSEVKNNLRRTQTKEPARVKNLADYFN